MHVWFGKMLSKINSETPVLDKSDATHDHAKAQAWLTKHPRVYFHLIPTSSSWLNLVERFFANITAKQIRRGVFRSVQELEAAIGDYGNVEKSRQRRSLALPERLARPGVALLPDLRARRLGALRRSRSRTESTLRASKRLGLSFDSAQDRTGRTLQ